ncbi:MAG: pentapeptide repeat-containing protein, partial [Moorea sp. SIO3C2]|nr:pentapeptide repeat-containing protein [Moorena sp. SIO3C2]
TAKLDRARLGTSYLQDQEVRQLLITGEGQDKNWDGLDLRGINVKGANLQDASFIGTDLNRANLENANLSRAKLVQTLLEGADLTRSTLTGAYIEDWGISNTTKLSEIDCDYIFLKLPTQNEPDPKRRPADQERNFEPGEFAKLAQRIPNTVDLVFQDGIDWQTFLKTFQEIRVESETEELPVIQTMENKGDGAFVIRVKVPENFDEAEYEQKFRAEYNEKLEAKDREIKRLYKQTKSDNKQIKAIRKDNTKLIKIVGTMADKETTKYDQRGAKINIGSYVDTAESGSHQQGHANQNIHEAPDKNLTEAAAEIQQLLEQLSQNNPTTTSKENKTVVSEVVEKIENNPTLKYKVINALKAGGVEAFKEALDHPLVNTLMATIEGWKEA